MYAQQILILRLSEAKLKFYVDPEYMWIVVAGQSKLFRADTSKLKIFISPNTDNDKNGCCVSLHNTEKPQKQRTGTE